MGRFIAIVLLLVSAPAMSSAAPVRMAQHPLTFRVVSGPYTVGFNRTRGAIIITRKGTSGGLSISEISGNNATDLLHAASSVYVNAGHIILSGRGTWGAFVLRFDTNAHQPTLLHWQLSVDASRDVPLVTPTPDITFIQVHGLHPAHPHVTVYASATPVAGSSVYLADPDLNSVILYFANYTALGNYFQATREDPTQGNFPYPNASDEALVGVQGNAFGYEPPPGSLQLLPTHHPLVLVDSYLALLPSIPHTEGEIASDYLTLTDEVLRSFHVPLAKRPRWSAIAQREIVDLVNSSNWVSLHGHRYLRSYVSDQRTAPELITQLSVLLGLRSYLIHAHTSSPLAHLMVTQLDGDLQTFFDSHYHTVLNNTTFTYHPSAQSESWYYVGNLISLLQLAKLGDKTAKRLLLDSINTTITLAHRVNYIFPQDFTYRDLHGSGGVQRDVAGGYAYLMLGLYDLTHAHRYLAEAMKSIAHIAGAGFTLSYELHMTAYSAAAAQQLYQLTQRASYRDDAFLALANFFHATRLWDCTYGSCRQGYHTFMGVNPLPWSDYIAMREQYDAWLGLRAYAAAHPTGAAADLVRRYLSATLTTMQYTLPPLLPRGADTAKPTHYAFVTQNRLDWYIPFEDLREGFGTSGEIGQEIYGAGGPLIFAAFD
jgi:hypothetical protein